MKKKITIKSILSLFTTLSCLGAFAEEPQENSSATPFVLEVVVDFENMRVDQAGNVSMVTNIRTNSTVIKYVAGTEANAKAICWEFDMDYRSHENFGRKTGVCSMGGCFYEKLVSLDISSKKREGPGLVPTRNFLQSVICEEPSE